MSKVSSLLDDMSKDPDLRSPVVFKQILLSSLNDEAKVLHILFSTIPISDIILFKHQEIEYDLQLDIFPLDRPEGDPERNYRQLKHTAREGVMAQSASIPMPPVVESFRSTLPKHPNAKTNDGDFFLPIGWVMEKVGMGELLGTRYVCMLNVSTQPISMWAVYNYLFYNDEDDTYTDLEDLSLIYINDVPDDRWTRNPVTGAGAVMKWKDLFLLYEDVKEWHPDRATVWNKPGKEAHLLGHSVRAHDNVLPPKELLDAITVKDDKQEPKTEICMHNAVYAHATPAYIVNQPTGKEDAVNESAITGDTRQTVDEYVINNGDTVKEDAIMEDDVKEDATSKPSAQKSTINNAANLPSPNILSSEVLPKEVLPTKAKPKRTASRTMPAGPPACKQRTK